MADVSQHTTADMLDEALAAARDAMTAAMDDEPDDEDMGDDDTMEDDEDEDPEFYDSEEDNDDDEDRFGDVRIWIDFGPEDCIVVHVKVVFGPHTERRFSLLLLHHLLLFSVEHGPH
jgi:hypothetical protein